MPMDPVEAYYVKSMRKEVEKTRVWCAMSQCKFNKNMICKANVIRMHVHTDGRMKCLMFTRIDEKESTRKLEEFKDDWLAQELFIASSLPVAPEPPLISRVESSEKKEPRPD